MNIEDRNENDTLVDSPTHSVKKKTEWSNLLIVVGALTTFGTSVPVGYNIGVTNALAEYIKYWSNHTIIDRYDSILTEGELDTLWSAIVSIFLIGGAIGSLGGSWIADKLGRKKSLLICGILFIFSALCFVFCRTVESVELLVIGRFIVGLASGLTTTTVPMYLTELAPLSQRGQLGVLCSMGVTGGVVVGQIFSLQQIFGTEDLWQFSLSAFAILVVICFLPYLAYPESPKYLYIVVGKKDEAIKELKRLRGENYDMQEELAVMDTERGIAAQTRSLWSVITDSKLLLPLVLVCALQGGQQLSGINAVFYYSVRIFESAGLSSTNAKWANLGAGCINLLVSCFSPVLMSKINRRPLALLSCLMSSLFLLTLTFIVEFIDQVSWFSFACIAAIFGYIIFYQIGLGPIPYFIGSELFEAPPRSAAMSMGSLSSWTCNFIIGMSFPPLQTAWGAFVFLPFSIVCFGLAVLLKFYLPETRGKDSSDIVPLVSNGFRSKPCK